MKASPPAIDVAVGQFEPALFLDAQAPIYASVLTELKGGRKNGHWMWFIFPQLVGLGSSAYSARFGLEGVREAQAFLTHPVLGPRLRECIGLLLTDGHRSPGETFSGTDILKLHACLTLFDKASSNDLFQTALFQLFGGKPHQQTEAALRARHERTDLFSKLCQWFTTSTTNAS